MGIGECRHFLLMGVATSILPQHGDDVKSDVGIPNLPIHKKGNRNRTNVTM